MKHFQTIETERTHDEATRELKLTAHFTRGGLSAFGSFDPALPELENHASVARALLEHRRPKAALIGYAIIQPNHYLFITDLEARP